MDNWLLWLALGIMLIGAIGTIAPLLPGTPLIFAGVLLYGLFDGFVHLSVSATVAILILMVMSLVVEYFSGVIGAKSFGASKYGNWGALIGGLTGLLWLPLGLILGPLFGAILGELYYKKDLQSAFRSGIGTLVGLMGGTLIKLGIAFTMVGIFIWQVF